MDDGRSGYSAAWSPDGGRVAFAALGLHIVGADGVGVRELSLNDRLSRLCCVTNLTWSPDGETIAFTAGPDDFREVYVIAPDGGGLTQWSDYRADGAALSVAWRPVGRGEG
jgi:Tol biopolymer transport system component